MQKEKLISVKKYYILGFKLKNTERRGYNG